MRKIFTSIVLLITMTFNVVFFSACAIVDSLSDKRDEILADEGDDKNGQNTGTNVPIPNDVKVMLEGKYSDFELSRDKLESALTEAIKKIDYALPTFTDMFPSESSKNNVYTPVDNTRSSWTTGHKLLWKPHF